MQLQFCRGVGTRSIELGHPLAAPVRRALTDGNLTGAWCYALLDDEAGRPRVIGSFVRTPRSRLLFCPAFHLSVSDKDNAACLVQLDHLTLDPPENDLRYQSHVALVDGRRALRFNASPESGWMFPWFVLVVPGVQGLEVLPRVLNLPHDCPGADLGRRPQASVGEYQSPPTIGFASDRPDGESFIQLDVWVVEGGETTDLSSASFNLRDVLVANGGEGAPTLTGQTEFGLGGGACTIRILARHVSGRADRPCLLRVRPSSSEAWLL